MHLLTRPKEMWRTSNAGPEAGKLWLSVVDQTVENITRIYEALPPELRLVDGIAQNRAALMLNLRVHEVRVPELSRMIQN